MTAEAHHTGDEGDGTFGDELPNGTVLLRGQYTIERFLNSGGFGMTYLARDSLDRTVVIKECFPSSMCMRQNKTVRVRSRAHADEFEAIVRLFGQEARALAKLQHPHIVGVHQVFEDNHTAYMALDFVEGRDMLDVIEQEPYRLGPIEIKEILLKMLSAVAYIHDRGILHRDISPDNILLDDYNNPVLIDFGAAREEAIRVSRVLSAQHTVKDGYSPQEFYVHGSKQTLSADLYALAATFYHLISGNAPPVSQARLSAVAEDRPDSYQPLLGYNRDYDRFFLGAIDKCLEIFPKDRLQSAHEWLEEIDEARRRQAARAKAKKDQQMEDAILALVEETNKEVLVDTAPAAAAEAQVGDSAGAPQDAEPRATPRPFPELRDNPTQIITQASGASKTGRSRSFFGRIFGVPFRRPRQDAKPQSDNVGKAGR
ncbi:MAG: serine/threonine-protein kinase [Pseudomonadota bacterium]